LDLTARTIQRWRRQDGGEDRRHGPLTDPVNKFSAEERQRVITTSNAPNYRDLSPKQIVPKLADTGVYIGSEATFYRILREEDQVNHRERSRPATNNRPREKKAD
jgi:hypothetical protein